MSVKVYNKLVRDKIPEIIRQEGKDVKFRVLDNDEYLDELLKKLGEEHEELKIARNAEELADISEVLLALADALGINQVELDKIRTHKVAKRGAFKQKILLVSVDENLN